MPELYQAQEKADSINYRTIPKWCKWTSIFHMKRNTKYAERRELQFLFQTILLVMREIICDKNGAEKINIEETAKNWKLC